jgi:hypothetical protein
MGYCPQYLTRTWQLAQFPELLNNTAYGHESLLQFAEAFLASRAQVAREHDLTLNFSKCDIVCADAEVALFRNEFPEITRYHVARSILLLDSKLIEADQFTQVAT